MLELIRSDIFGLMSATARDGYQYFITFTDELNIYGHVYLMKHKSESLEKFKELYNQLIKKMKLLQ